MQDAIDKIIDSIQNKTTKDKQMCDMRGDKLNEFVKSNTKRVTEFEEAT